MIPSLSVKFSNCQPVQPTRYTSVSLFEQRNFSGLQIRLKSSTARRSKFPSKEPSSQGILWIRVPVCRVISSKRVNSRNIVGSRVSVFRYKRDKSRREER